jgi:hypothetical protein
MTRASMRLDTIVAEAQREELLALAESTAEMEETE